MTQLISPREQRAWTVGVLLVCAAVLLLALLLAWLFLSARQAAAQEIIYNEWDTLAAVEGQPYPIACIVWHETVPKWNPYSVGWAGELGAVQLHPRGELLNFYAQGYTNPFNPYEAVEFLVRHGETHGWTFRPWTTWRRYCQ